MSEVVKTKLEIVCPNVRLFQMYMKDVESEVYRAFEEINYSPSSDAGIKKAIDKAWAKADRSMFLFEFVYLVWRCDS